MPHPSLVSRPLLVPFTAIAPICRFHFPATYQFVILPPHSLSLLPHSPCSPSDLARSLSSPPTSPIPPTAKPTHLSLTLHTHILPTLTLPPLTFHALPSKRAPLYGQCSN
ncbi:hypothetical protein E2C01_089422 [Portunus trituberculatus]|uniref:Uncharacterized protein n=1 Tax=Portunus trituberculatus TaxID=210409 RepID=A0A5B7JBX8_PORTR|nr:hypothetical protein [Portunus trituberculatus]